MDRQTAPLVRPDCLLPCHPKPSTPTEPAAHPTGHAAVSTASAWSNVVLAAVLILATLPGRTQGLGLITESLLRDLHMDRVAYADMNLWATLLGATFCLPAGWLYRPPRLALDDHHDSRPARRHRGAHEHARPELHCALHLGRPLPRPRSKCSHRRQHYRRRKKFCRSRGLAHGRLCHALQCLPCPRFSRRRLVGLPLGLAHRLDGGGLRPPRRHHAHRALSPRTGPARSICWTPPRPGENAPRSALRARPSSGSSLQAQDSSSSSSPASDFSTRPFSPSAASIRRLIIISSALPKYVRSPASSLCGWLSTRRPLTRLLAGALFLFSLGLAALPLLHSHLQLWLFAATFGTAAGFINVIYFAVWGHAFGRAHLGRIQGAAQMAAVLATAVGPLIFAKCQKSFGSFTPVMVTLAAITFCAGLVAWHTKMISADSPSS